MLEVTDTRRGCRSWVGSYSARSGVQVRISMSASVVGEATPANLRGEVAEVDQVGGVH